ncbi:MAG: hypothetical protein AVDCRST_MAG89-1687 [uncultured Gemmatimonadetes bacterium]|uniref:protein-tyrosine-phosphatase n=1 Tax=uncultured Gemmatimonadota bacterium TaxID=203437 RepID=A0A6J4L3L4_9BACT|nr:MAG: hypothetical protein AVDCRST_MAG89-1687 [uncultured Gemmatimonadota bacterium]
MIDFHSHLMPAVDDGAATLDESRQALARMRDAGVTALVTTPHFHASATEHPGRLAQGMEALDRGWRELSELAAAEFPALRVERGVELMLDSPRPVLDDPRLRLAGTRFVLVEFPFQGVPPGAARVLFDLKVAGWLPIVAHPERYPQVGQDLAGPEEWRRVGAALQVNWGSLAGRYGPGPQRIAWALLNRGWADYLSSDYHARGRLGVGSAREMLLARGGQEQLRMLSEENPARMLAGEPPLEVPSLPDRPGFWRRLMGRGPGG